MPKASLVWPRSKDLGSNQLSCSYQSLILRILRSYLSCPVSFFPHRTEPECLGKPKLRQGKTNPTYALSTSS